MLFTADNTHYFQPNSTIHELNERYKNKLQVPSIRLSTIQTATTYSAI